MNGEPMKILKLAVCAILLPLGVMLIGDTTAVYAQGGHGGHGGMHSGHGKKTAKSSDDTVRPTLVDGVQVVKITVTGSGYSPSRITVKEDVPVRLVFEQFSASACAAQIQIPSLGVPKVSLAQGRETPVEFTPTKTGSYAFTCGMEMLTGTLVVE
jgi:heme/copper-type cytochrome/quinol oxidase subunit 2